MRERYLSNLLELRLLVGFLGERAQYSWWPTAFYDKSSHLFLEPAFPKTYRLAQYHGVVEAARRLHDEQLNVGAYHLFRLPEEVEEDLHAMVQPGNEASVVALADREAAVAALAKLAGAQSAAAIGPIAVGSAANLSTAKIFQSIAAHYHHGFSKGVRVYPYLTR